MPHTLSVDIQQFSGLKMVIRRILKNIKVDVPLMISKNGSKRTDLPQQRTNCSYSITVTVKILRSLLSSTTEEIPKTFLVSH